MIAIIKKLLNRTPKPKPYFNHSQAIRVYDKIPARKVYTNIECYIDKNMLLIYQGESEEEFFFTVRTNFYSVFGKTDYALDRDNVFINKELLKASKFKRL